MMIQKYLPLIWVFTGLVGCSTASPTPDATLLAGMHQYQDEMQSLAGSLTRWPERQRAADMLKTVALATFGGSREFFRMVDLDLRKKEFDVTMRLSSVRPDRLQEMQEEMILMNDEIAALKPIVKAQIAEISIRGDGKHIENIATLGLLTLALDEFSANGRGVQAPSTWIDRHLVIDLGSFATVKSPDGQTFRCAVVSVAEQGGSVRCEGIK